MGYGGSLARAGRIGKPLIGTNRLSRRQTIGNEWKTQYGSGAMGLWLQSLGWVLRKMLTAGMRYC
jgi:hypothetical protein